MNKYLFPKPRSDRLAVSRKKVGYRSKIKQFFLFITDIFYYLCAIKIMYGKDKFRS